MHTGVVDGHGVVDLQGYKTGHSDGRGGEGRCVERHVVVGADAGAGEGRGIVLYRQRRIDCYAVIAECGSVKTGGGIDQHGIVAEAGGVIGKAGACGDLYGSADEGAGVTGAAIESECFAGGDIKGTGGAAGAAYYGIEGVVGGNVVGGCGYG